MSIVAWFLYSPSKKLVFVPVASATDGGHRDCPVLASVAQWPEIQPLVSRGQIVSAVLPLLTDRQTHRRTTIIFPSEARSLLGLDRGLYGFFASF